MGFVVKKCGHGVHIGVMYFVLSYKLCRKTIWSPSWGGGVEMSICSVIGDMGKLKVVVFTCGLRLDCSRGK